MVQQRKRVKGCKVWFDVGYTREILTSLGYPEDESARLSQEELSTLLRAGLIESFRRDRDGKSTAPVAIPRARAVADSKLVESTSYEVEPMDSTSISELFKVANDDESDGWEDED